MATISTIAIALSTVTIIVLLFFIFAKRGWNCTENGCVYGIGGSFDTYDKCTSSCKSNQVQSQSQSQSRVGSEERQNQDPIQVPIPYYSYLPNPWVGPWYNDYYNRDRYHQVSPHGNHNNNQNHIFFNSPTGPNTI